MALLEVQRSKVEPLKATLELSAVRLTEGFCAGLALKLAETVQLEVIAPVVYVFPDKNPLQPEVELMLYPEFGVTEKVVVLPEITSRELGEMFPPDPALVLTV